MLSLLSLGCWASAYPRVAYAAAQAREELPAAMTFDWTDEQGATTQLSRWHGKTLLVTMAYSTCRQVCSFTLHQLEELQKSADRVGSPIEVVVISYDPNVDGPVTWSIYRRHHHLDRANWHFLTGSVANTRQFAAALEFPYWRYDEHLVHDFKILLIGPDGGIAKILTWATRNDDFFTETAANDASAGVQGRNQ